MRPSPDVLCEMLGLPALKPLDSETGAVLILEKLFEKPLPFPFRKRRLPPTISTDFGLDLERDRDLEFLRDLPPVRALDNLRVGTNI